ncbi:MAG: TlpA family protein disulfide reductase [Chlorobi bacterium]|nr:TlpA family protein disulfide reductase [Chlorobiota bacterium]
MNANGQKGLSPRQLWKKHKANIFFVLFLAWMILFPRNPVRIWMTKGAGLLRMAVERIELPEKKQETLRPQDLQWQLTDLAGKTVTLEQLGDKPVLINVWATWCPPCVAELPSLEQLYRRYGDRVHFVFLADDDPAKVRAFLDKRGLDIPVYFETAPRPFALRTSAIPTTFVLDRNRRVRVRKTGAMNWNSRKVRKLLDRLLAEEDRNSRP